MIDRFNFYDIYGFVLPGTLLVAIFWLPFGLATSSLPSSEISTTLLLLVLAYIAGQLLQMFAEVVVPSKVRDSKGNLRERSSLIIDMDNQVFGEKFKTNLGEQISSAFGVKIFDDKDAMANRRSAFFEARTYLLENKTTGYVEQFEGLYAMMRGFGCAFFVGCAYLVGWGLSFHWAVQGMPLGVWLVLMASIAGALIATGFTIYFEAKVLPAVKTQPGKLEANPADEAEQEAIEAEQKAYEAAREKLEENKKASYVRVSVFMLFFVAGLGYFLGTWKPAGAQIEFFLWAALPVGLIAGIRCLHAYAGYAENFAETVWRDFSASYKPDSPAKPEKAKPPAGAHAGAHADGPGGAHPDAPAGPKGQHAAGGGGGHGHEGAAKPEHPQGHGGEHGGHQKAH